MEDVCLLYGMEEKLQRMNRTLETVSVNLQQCDGGWDAALRRGCVFRVFHILQTRCGILLTLYIYIYIYEE